MSDTFLHWRRHGWLLLSLLLFTLCSVYFYGQTGDDSYIYFRYVERALAGQWWSWSSHIEPVEGYSSPFWYLLLVVTAKLGVPVITAAKLWGLLFALLTLVGCYRLARVLGAASVLAGFACTVLSLNQGFHYWATSGLETAFYAAIYVWACIGIIQLRYWVVPVMLIGVGRPEGMILLLALLLCIYWVKRPPPHWLLLAALPTLAWLLWRLHIYGVPLSNTYYAKATGDVSVQVQRGLMYALPVLPLFVGAWLLWWKTRWQALMITLGMVSLLLGIIVAGGGDWMFHYRLLVPVLALLLAIWAGGWCRLASHLQHAVWAVLLVPALLLTVQPEHWRNIVTLQPMPLVYYQEGNMTDESIKLASAIRAQYPGKKLIAVNHAGALPWALPEYDFIDMAGLNDAHIARRQGAVHRKYDVDYVLASKPDLIVLNTRTKPGTDGIWYHPGYWAGEDALVAHPDFARFYQPTALVYPWDWVLPMPHRWIYGREIRAWILVYERKPGL